jgi:type VI secretion system protein ImpF
MARVNPRQQLIPSILDRLLQSEADVSVKPQWQKGQSLRELEQAVRRDLEALLNARMSHPELADTDDEVKRSMVTYGLPDFSHANPESPVQRERFRKAVEQAIDKFEPRLKYVKVDLQPSKNKFDRSLRLTIAATLEVKPVSEPITFDTVVSLQTGDCEVHTRT